MDWLSDSGIPILQHSAHSYPKQTFYDLLISPSSDQQIFYQAVDLLVANWTEAKDLVASLDMLTPSNSII